MIVEEQRQTMTLALSRSTKMEEAEGAVEAVVERGSHLQEVGGRRQILLKSLGSSLSKNCSPLPTFPFK